MVFTNGVFHKSCVYHTRRRFAVRRSDLIRFKIYPDRFFPY